MAKLTPDQLSMFSQMTSGTLTNATSLQESQDGLTLSDLQDGQTTEKSGRAAARASRSALQEKVKELTMSGIYGRTFFDSLEAVAPQLSWVSKLQVRLGMVGSTESDLIWKVKATPSTASIFRLAPQTRRTSGPGYTGSQKTWVSPTAQDGTRGNLPPREWDTGIPLSQEVVIAESTTWPSPTAMDTMEREGMRPSREATNRTTGYLSEAVVTYAQTWQTPTVEDASRQGNGDEGEAWQRERIWPDAGADGNSFWRNAIWLNGADGKTRRAEPNIRLLAHGVPARVGKLRAYGNAIVPPLAAEVIKAFMESQ